MNHSFSTLLHPVCSALPIPFCSSVRLVCGHQLKLQGRWRNTATYSSKHCLKAFCQQRAVERDRRQYWRLVEHGSKGVAYTLVAGPNCPCSLPTRTRCWRCGTQEILFAPTISSNMQYSAGSIKLYCTAQNRNMINNACEQCFQYLF